jgi:hypothetical protein
MKKRYLALLCAAMLLLALCACKAESSSQSTVTVTSGTTDENGVTTTTTNTSEAGISVGTDGVKTTENQTTETVVETPAPTEEPEDAQEEAEEEFTFDDWAARFTGGAIGRNADGDQFGLAWDDPDDITYAALMILNPDGTEVSVREGEVTIAGADDNVHLLLTDTVREVEVPFNFYSSDEGDFAMFFLANADTAVMTEVEYDEVIGAFAQVISAIEG